MRKATMVWLIVAASLILAGCIMFVGAMSATDWKWSGFSTDKYASNEHKISEAFENISINTSTADIKLIPCAESESRVVCYERDKLTHSVTVKDGTLSVELKDTREWYDHIGIYWEAPKIDVYIPAGQYIALTVTDSTGDVNIPKDFSFEKIEVNSDTGEVRNFADASSIKIDTSTGDITLEGVSAGSLKLRTSTGDIWLSTVECEGDVSITVSTGDAYIRALKCKNLLSEGSTGDITLTDTVATEKFSIKRSTGEVELERCDAAEIYITTDTGDVEGSLLSDKVFIVKTDTGDVIGT